MDVTLKVGQLASQTGLTVRTLHHYDEIGLLSPSRRTAVGHRLYGEEEVRRLQHIATLKHLGLSLEEIRDFLDGPDSSLEHALSLQIERIDEEIDRRHKLRELISSLLDRLLSGEPISVDQLTRSIEVTMNYEKYYSVEQLDLLAKRRSVVGEERIRAVETAWKTLFAAFGKAMEEGLDPTSPEVKVLARRSSSLIEEFTGGDPGIMRALGNLYQGEGPASVMAGNDMPLPPGLWEYMGKAQAAVRDDGPSGGGADSRMGSERR
ncbi:MAG: MerR family transcriptional regulator [Gemmatimonadetes bacterium]|nr:MerR family transcriptional regulator [Gemmatimonadota bacterium]NNL31101.1 MerR family transcriptional regulator [Gemmatimonadota bacterium]